MTLATAKQDGIAVTASNGSRQDEILSPAALAFLADLQREFNGTRKRLLKLREERQKRFDAGELPDFLAETTACPRRRLARRADPGRPAGPPRGDHRPGRSQDDHQCAELGRESVHGRLRGRLLPDLGQHDRGPGQSEGSAGRARSTSPSRPPARPTSCPTSRPSCWCARAAGICPRITSLVDGEPMSASLFDFGLYVFHNAKAIVGQGLDPRLLPAEAGEPSRSAPLERRLHPRRGEARGCPRARSRRRS